MLAGKAYRIVIRILTNTRQRLLVFMNKSDGEKSLNVGINVADKEEEKTNSIFGPSYFVFAVTLRQTFFYFYYDFDGETSGFF